MKNYVRAALATGIAVLALGTFASPASAAERADTPKSPSAAQRSGTPDGAHWYIGSGDAYGEVIWRDYYPLNGDDADIVVLNDDLSPSGYSVKMTVVHGSFKKTVHAYNGKKKSVRIPGFTKGEKAKFKACAWDNGEEVGGSCRPWTTIVE